MEQPPKQHSRFSWITVLVVALAPLAAQTSAAVEGEINPREHSEVVAEPHHVYTIHMGGTIDGVNSRDPIGYGVYQQAWVPNHYALMENIGDEVVVNPWIIVNGKRDWRSVDTILAGILDEGMSDAEKARAIWEFGRRHRYHYTSGTDDVKDVVKMVNIYGYTLCWDAAFTMSNLWQAAGLKIRRGMPHGHCTTEVYYDGMYHLLDSDEHLLVLMRDNETIAGEAEISRDHDLMKRSHAYGILRGENRQTSEFSASLFCYLGPRSGGRPYIGGHRMELTLRPGEGLRWEWADRGKYHGVWERPQRLANGRHHFRPRLDEGFGRWAEEAINLRAGAGGVELVEEGSEAHLVYRLTTPYVFVGGRLEAELLSGSDPWQVEVQTEAATWVEVGQLAPGAGAVSLDAHIRRDGPPVHTYRVRLRGTAGGLASLHLESDLQMAPLSLPELEVGTNQILYTDDNQGDRQVRITHRWDERRVAPPPAPARALYPEDGGEVEGTQLTFRWSPVAAAVDYHFELSRYSDMEYTLSPVFEKLVSKTPSAGQAQWRIPEPALLNPDETYYWRVRSRNKDGLWGPWSQIWNFIPHAPGVPLEVVLTTDWDRRSITLSWQPNPAGNRPVHYEVYGSDERGFSVSRTPYMVYTGSTFGAEKRSVEFPANLLGSTRETSMVVASPDLDEGSGNRSFYRVVAVDGNQVRSGASDYAEAPRPFIYSRPPARLVSGRTYQYQVKALASIGDLRSITDPQTQERIDKDRSIRYQDAFRDGDELVFLLDEGPTMVALDRESGLMTLTPQVGHIGTHTVTFRVQSQQGGGVDVQGFDIEVVREAASSEASTGIPGT